MGQTIADASKSIEELVSRRFPGSVLEGVTVLGADAGGQADTTEKAIGYGALLQIAIRDDAQRLRQLVLHTATANDFGHDRRSDRAAEMLLAFDTMGSIPRHVAPIDVGVIDAGGGLQSLANGGEFYLLTEFAPGRVYAHDLRRIAQNRSASARDTRRLDTLVAYLVELHRRRLPRPSSVYVRAIRDLVGSGEGVFGLVDGFPNDVPAAPPARLFAIERQCAEWRWRLRDRSDRLTTTHGDFHPFNLLFDDNDELAVLDSSRGSAGDAADDAVCLALNYVFFALDHPGAWDVFRPLWMKFWCDYLASTEDDELCRVAPPFVAWRALVMSNPRWYPKLSPRGRDELLSFVERTLQRGALEPTDVDVMFADQGAIQACVR